MAPADAGVTVGTRTYRTGATGIVRIPVDAGVIEIRVAKEGFALVTTSVTVSAGQEQAVVIE